MSEEKIFHIRYTVDLVIQAPSLADAESLTKRAWQEAERNGGLEPDVQSIDPVTKCSQMPYGWDGKCLPFLGDGKRRLEEMLEE
ncbi:hypothetical protein [Pseudomonas oryzihabitans]|uniref:hypothetical protein n=1 Tax=Pseudomonas oryzihabitans TaxID=47885 RepID=UPI003EB96944